MLSLYRKYCLCYFFSRNMINMKVTVTSSALTATLNEFCEFNLPLMQPTNRPVTITTSVGRCIVSEIITINNIIDIWRSFYTSDVMIMKWWDWRVGATPQIVFILLLKWITKRRITHSAWWLASVSLSMYVSVHPSIRTHTLTDSLLQQLSPI